MTSVIFAILFGLIFVIFPCKGQISLPPGGDNFVVLPGENVTLPWKLDVSLSTVLARSWTFLPNNESFAEIGGNAGVVPNPEYAPGPFTIEKPSTLILENVTIQYSGIYRFTIFASNKLTKSDVTVTVAVKPPNVTINCTNNPLTINEGKDFTCLCEAKGGKPPADVTWEKDGVLEPGGSGKEQKLLSQVNVSIEDSGTYTCVAKSHTLTNNNSIEVKVYAKPNVKIEFNPKRVQVGGSVTITCTSRGFPEPKYNITHNGTEVSTEKTYKIPTVNKTHAGTYKCFVWNIVGNDSDSKNLVVEGQITPTRTISVPSTTQATSNTTNKGTDGPTTTSPPGVVPTGAIVGSTIGVLVLIIIVVVVVVYCCKSKEKERGNRANIDPVPGNHYELENEEPGPGDGAYDTVGPVGASSSKSKPPAGNTLPPVYAAVDKNNRQGNTLYASLDTEALQTSRASKKEPDRPPQAEYASIDFGKSAPKADLV